MSKKVFDNLLKWSKSQYSHLPWRESRSLYGTLVSEIMLQQTTVGTVINHFQKFLDQYPTIQSLADASEEDVCISWKGLGYYRRARSLRNLAIQICDVHQGIIPTDLETLLSLKGIGPYTANAIVAIGADQKGLAVDANLERVLARFYGIDELKGPKLQQKIYLAFDGKKILLEMNKLSPRDLNEALMDLGRVLCQAKKASCSLCSLKSECMANKLNKQLEYPRIDTKKKGLDLIIKLLRVVVREKSKILFYQKSHKEWLAGQWELPTFIFHTNDELLKQYPKIKPKIAFEKLPMIKSGITKYKIENYIVEMDYRDFQKLTKTIEIDFQFKTHNNKLNLSTSSIKSIKLISNI